jgi:hypothetical protein
VPRLVIVPGPFRGGSLSAAEVLDDDGNVIARGHIETTGDAAMVAAVLGDTERGSVERQIELGIRFVGEAV